MTGNKYRIGLESRFENSPGHWWRQFVLWINGHQGMRTSLPERELEALIADLEVTPTNHPPTQYASADQDDITLRTHPAPAGDIVTLPPAEAERRQEIADSQGH